MRPEQAEAAAHRSYDPNETRRMLLTAATQLFHAYGYHATSVSAIVDEAQVTKGAFYYHFNSKREVLYEIRANYIEERLRHYREITENADSPVEQLRQLVRDSLIAMHEHRAEVAVFMQERQFLSGKEFDALKSKRDELEKCYLSVLLRGVQQGLFSDDFDPRLVTFAIVGMGAWASAWFTPDGQLHVDDVVDQLVDLVLSGVVGRAD